MLHYFTCVCDPCVDKFALLCQFQNLPGIQSLENVREKSSQGKLIIAILILSVTAVIN